MTPDYRPPRWLDGLAGRLVPPASAEHVLGDLTECSSSDLEYLRHLASILPGAIWIQVRRRGHRAGVRLNAILSALVLVVAHGFPRAPFFAEPWALLRLALPWALWVTGCILAAAYGLRDRPQEWSRTVFFGTIVAALGGAALASCRS